MAVNRLGIVIVPSCSGHRLFSPNLWGHLQRLFVCLFPVLARTNQCGCLSSSDSTSPPSSSISGPNTKLYLSGLSFRTTEDNLRKAFEQFVNLVMDKVANRPRGFAFLRYETEEESMKAIEGMHGKFLDGRVIFVEEAKPMSDIQRAKPRSDFNRAQTKRRVPFAPATLIMSPYYDSV
ncbi:LOW QUALITY PROTEIN: hypothetical protein BRARA_B02096 [Brassica rapa]|uniref:RRM domain-containing protein n=1 Tax=Brassica campestris TaxID=3711 RepID=A0A398AB81_BRACM|nr:LOW QUALITY PROTEIN: hypothetical protein BRARA_B02096 [Brassica rapa]